jgi:GT2 family glycosyltransferase
MIVGKFKEPFLGAALRSVDWADGFSVVNTDPDGAGYGQENELIVRRTVPREKLRLDRVWMGKFDFAKARNASLAMIPEGAYALLVDADDVHWPEFEGVARGLVSQGHDVITGHFWHHVLYKDLWAKEPHREILFSTGPEVRFENSVHEGLVHPRANPALAGTYHWSHYGYIKPPREIFKRWVLYSELEGDPDHYAGRNPDDALAGWLDGCQPFWREHPPAVREVLESYPKAPRSARALPEGVPCNVGLVMLTWDDAENLRTCLKSLATTRQPFELCVVDNGSTDGSLEGPLWELQTERGANHPARQVTVYFRNGLSLAHALNEGFQHFMDRPEIDYIGWIHPDMVFERDTWLECLRHALDTHPDVVKVGAAEMNAQIPVAPIHGNSQCYLVRRSALEQVGLFDERFLDCGGREDWDHNKRLMEFGHVMIWPDALIRHNAMGTRSKHDNEAAARRNADYYFEKWGTYGAPV